MTSLEVHPPDGPLTIDMTILGSKSVANRALICAMLADGQSVLHGIPDGDDTAVIVDLLTEMSVGERTSDSIVIQGSRDVRLPGIVDAGLAGTSSRFLTAVAALSTNVTVVDGQAPLRSRPMGELHDALRQLGVTVEPLGQPGHLPVSISGGKISGGELSIHADVSSQFISALMLVAPTFSEGLTLRVMGEQVSQSYIHMTARVMSAFGVDVVFGDNTIEIPGSTYRACTYVVEPDFSSAAFPIVAVLMRGGNAVFPRLGLAMAQGDAEILAIASQLGADVRVDGSDIVIEAPPGLFVDEITLSMSQCSDLVPVVAVLLTRCVGRGQIRDVGFIRNKESDRLGDVAQELKKVGADVEVTDDGLVVRGGRPYVGAQLATHHDHRLAMSFALLGLVCDGIVIENPEVVAKSWPAYFSDMADILGPITREN